MYGLTEIYREKIQPARLVANPGCYPTSVQLPLYPLLQSKLISPQDIIIDSKSGRSMQVVVPSRGDQGMLGPPAVRHALCMSAAQ